MKAQNVKLYILIRLANGEQVRATPAYSRNKTALKRLVAVVNGVEQHHPEASYVLRYRGADGRRHWEAIGSDPDVALATRVRKEKELQLTQDAASMGVTVNGLGKPANRVKLADAIAEYLTDICNAKAGRTHSNRVLTLRYFQESCSKQYLDDINRRDILDFRAWLYAHKLSDRSVFNRFQSVLTCLKAMGLERLVLKTDWPTYTEKVVRAYNEDEVKLLLAASGDMRLVFQFFLYSGAREQEVMFACWSDLDFRSKTYTVREKRDLGFKPKDREERAIPIPDALCKLLEERKGQHPDDRLVFPTKAGLPDGHRLRDLKKAAYKAGLNCGHCVNRVGQRCAEGPYCKHWNLHKFRKTFATLHHESGNVSARTLQAWLGHSDLETTLHYLESADIRSDRVREAVNATFAALA